MATTIVSVEEQLSGWYTLLRRAKTATELVPVYQRMSDTLRFLSALPILTFTETSARTYDQLRRAWPRRGRMDLRIAAIAMAFDAVLVTSNFGDAPLKFPVLSEATGLHRFCATGGEPFVASVEADER